MYVSFFRVRFIAMLVFFALFASAAYGFAATNTVQTTGAGDGQGTISGYTTSAIAYTLNSTTPSNIDAVAFTLTPATGLATAPTVVKVKLLSTGTTYAACTLAASQPASPASAWTCNVTSLSQTVATANELRVIAAQ
jgi:hypothetical protein